MIIALLLIFAAAGAACSKHQSDAQLAGEALQAGLKAHAEGNIAQAEADYRKVLVYDPQNKFAYYNLGLIDQTRGDVSAADESYGQVLAIDPNFVPALYNLAILRTPTDAKGAQQLYEHAVSIQPNYAAAHLNLGFLLIEAGQSKRGKSELATAVSLDPSLASRVPERYLSGTQGPVSPSPSSSPSVSGSPTASASG